MAVIGLNHLVIAPIDTYAAGAEPTYDDGMQVGHMMKADLSWKHGDAKLHGDNGLVERDNSITEGALTVGTTHISMAGREMMLGVEKYNTPTTGEVQEYANNDEPAPYVGCGYVASDVDDGTEKYIAYWYFKCQFQQDNENFETKGDSVNYQTPELVGTIFAVKPDTTGKNKFRKFAEFATEAAAIAWLDALAGITQSSGGGSGGSGVGS